MGKVKNLMVCLMVAMFTVSLFTGCGSNNATNSTAQTKKTEKIKLVLWDYYNGEQQIKAMRELISKFNSSQDKYVIEEEALPREELAKRLSIGLVADKLPDLVIIDNPDMASYAAMGMFADITDKVNASGDKDKYYPGPLLSNVYNDKYYGLPVGSNCLALYYNEDMLKAAGVKPPETWDELRAAAKKLTKDGVYGLAISALKNEEGTFQFLPWLLSSGANYDKLDSAEGIKSFQFITDLLNEGSMSKEIINWTQDDIFKQFTAKKVAMMVHGPWILETMRQSAPDVKFGVVKVPKDKVFASVLGGENIAVIKGHHETEGWEFIKYISQKENMAPLADALGYIPGRKDIAESSDSLKKDPIMAAFLDQIQYAMPRGPHPKWPEISNAISTAMQECFTNQAQPEAATHEAQVKVKAVLK